MTLGVLIERWVRGRMSPRLLASDIALIALAVAPWFAWSWFSTGQLTSLTAAAKSAFFAESNLPLLRKLDFFADALILSGILPLLLGVLFLFRTPVWFPVLFFYVAFFGAYFVVFAGGLSHNNWRYLYLLAPVGLVGYAVLLRELRQFSFIAVPAIFGGLLFFLPPQWKAFSEQREFTAIEQKSLVEWADSGLPKDARILLHDAGYFAWATSFSVFDIVGLKTPSSIDFHKKYTLPTGGADRLNAVDAIARKHNVTHAIILNGPFWGRLAEDLRNTGWALTELRSPNGRGYSVYAISRLE